MQFRDFHLNRKHCNIHHLLCDSFLTVVLRQRLKDIGDCALGRKHRETHRQPCDSFLHNFSDFFVNQKHGRIFHVVDDLHDLFHSLSTGKSPRSGPQPAENCFSCGVPRTTLAICEEPRAYLRSGPRHASPTSAARAPLPPARGADVRFAEWWCVKADDLLSMTPERTQAPLTQPNTPAACGHWPPALGFQKKKKIRHKTNAHELSKNVVHTNVSIVYSDFRLSSVCSSHFGFLQCLFGVRCSESPLSLEYVCVSLVFFAYPSSEKSNRVLLACTRRRWRTFVHEWPLLVSWNRSKVLRVSMFSVLWR